MLEKVPNILKLKDFWIRNPEDWKSKSFNLERQIINFVTWTLCKYPVPTFMYKLFLLSTSKRRELYRPRIVGESRFQEIYIDWFITIGQGLSFRKASKDFLSKKEAGLFLIAPKNNSITGNILWAKCQAQKAPDTVVNNLCSYWSDRFDGLNGINRKCWDKIVNFYSKCPEIDKDTVQDTMDFIYNAFYGDNKFSLAGRTLNSVISLTNEWHKELQIKQGKSSVSWGGLSIAPWQCEEKNNNIWVITQILNSRKLFHEGKVMKHCVGSYVSSCMSGRSGIFTVEQKQYGNTNKCLTVEVNSNFYVVQARGKCNRSPSKEERNVLIRWATDRQLIYKPYPY